MDFVLDLLQGVGLAAAIGVRPWLPMLLAGVLAAANLGLDFEGTDFAFLESVPVLVALAVLFVLGILVERRYGEPGPVLVYAVMAALLGAVEASASLADRGHSIIPGVVLGAAAGVLGYAAARTLFTRVRRRLDAEAAGALPVYAEGLALVAAGASILFPPLALLVLGGLAWLLAGGRRREGEKYAGLRVLR